MHVAWSGNHPTLAERPPAGISLLGGGELLLPGEIRLAPGETYASPWVFAAWSDAGLDGLSSRFHGMLRGRPRIRRRPRPVTLNTWEAVYFDQDLARLGALADLAAGVGVERFVLDDGWIRTHATTVAPRRLVPSTRPVWPDGLGPLDRPRAGRRHAVRALGRARDGILDSALAREHPEWVLEAIRAPWRHQQVLDLDQRRGA